MENFWTGACPKGGERVLKEDFLCTGRFPQRWAKGGAVESRKAGQSRDLEGRKQKKLRFLAHKQPKDYGPGQMAGMGNKRNPQKPHSTEGGPGTMREAQHTNLFREHRPCRTEGGPGDWKEHTGPAAQRAGLVN